NGHGEHEGHQEGGRQHRGQEVRRIFAAAITHWTVRIPPQAGRIPVLPLEDNPRDHQQQRYSEHHKQGTEHRSATAPGSYWPTLHALKVTCSSSTIVARRAKWPQAPPFSRRQAFQDETASIPDGRHRNSNPGR